MVKNIKQIQKYVSKIIENPSLIALYVFNVLENNNRWIVDNNGEKEFVDNIIEHFRKEHGNKKLIFFDLGAAEGDYLDLLLNYSKELKSEIHAFEPSKKSYKELEKRYVNKNKVLINNVAVSEKAKEDYIYYDRKGSLHASLIKRSDLVISLRHKSKTQIITLKDYIEDMKIKHIHLLKMDIEGSELSALKGLDRYLNCDFVDFIQFEYGGANLDSHTSLLDYYELFREKGFVIGKVFPRGLKLRKYEQWMDNYQMANYVAISQKIVKKVDKLFL